MCSLLCLLPLVAEGQTSASDASQWSNVPQVHQKEGVKWSQVLWDGGLYRKGQWYVQSAHGMSDLADANFVDGYSIGPHVVIGRMNKNRSRWEVEETVRWAIGRETLLAKGALRWYSPVEQGVMIEVRGGRHSEDFDHDPTMPYDLAAMASAIFGWSHFKMLERTEAGLRIALPLHAELDLKANLSWERRKALENHLHHSIFGAHARSNVPRVRDGRTVRGLTMYEGPVDGQMALMNLQLNYQRNRTIYVYDDMTARIQSSSPLVSLNADAGMGTWHYLTLGLQVSQDVRLPRRQDRLHYHVGGGNTFSHEDELSLVDWHHFNASRFWWQGSPDLTRFHALDNYELSTPGHWIEAHAEWKSDKMLVTHFGQDPALREFVQAHALVVSDHRVHWEMEWGLEANELMRIAFGMNMNGAKVHNVFATLSYDLQAARDYKRKEKKGWNH